MKPLFYLIKKSKILEIFIIIIIFSTSIKYINKSSNDLIIKISNIYNLLSKYINNLYILFTSKG